MCPARTVRQNQDASRQTRDVVCGKDEVFQVSQPAKLATDPSTPQAVVGAGAAGLVSTRELLREGHRVTTFEQHDNVGGIWDYQEECETEDLLGRNPDRRRVHSSM